MNIDVREYLRINPISVHELTLSQSPTDCFLFFKDNGPNAKSSYMVCTQRTLFHSLYSEMFKNLVWVYGDTARFNVNQIRVQDGNVKVLWNDNAKLQKDQFKNYLPRSTFEQFKFSFETNVGALETAVKNKVAQLRKKAIVDYPGAVELQTHLVNLIRDLHGGFNYMLGHIWCCSNGVRSSDGADECEIGELPLRHTHGDTKAEGTTEPFSSLHGGSSLIGDCIVGNKVRISSDNYRVAEGTNFNLIEAIQDSDLTYPLYGQNVVDWRDRTKPHDNMPPSTNVYVRCKPATTRKLRSVAAQARDNSSAARFGTNMAQYQSMAISDVSQEYSVDNLSDKDCTLRMLVSEDSSDVQMARQQIRALLDIFSDVCQKELAEFIDGKLVSMKDIMKSKLDQELVPSDEFLSWYNIQLGRLEKIGQDIDLIHKLLVEVQPVNYIGRIIMSTTDDIESKVIQKYGGKRWRRIEDFLRGVRLDNPNVGQKRGQEYVCLRESNIPTHVHQMQLESTTSTGQGATWLNANIGGEKSALLGSGEESIADGVENAGLRYQLSPLEYNARNGITYPHDNMPPYKEVYVWECVEMTDEEEQVVGPINDTHVVRLHENRGEEDVIVAAWNFQHG